MCHRSVDCADALRLHCGAAVYNLGACSMEIAGRNIIYKHSVVRCTRCGCGSFMWEAWNLVVCRLRAGRLDGGSWTLKHDSAEQGVGEH